MKLLCFQAKRFRWKTHSKSLVDAPDRDSGDEVEETVVAFVHAEESDGRDGRMASVLRQSVKHVKWLANKRGVRRVVLHSFTHLGGRTAPPELAESVLNALAGRLSESGYEVKTTPFGYSCEWELSVHGESLAKVWKEID